MQLPRDRVGPEKAKPTPRGQGEAHLPLFLKGAFFRPRRRLPPPRRLSRRQAGRLPLGPGRVGGAPTQKGQRPGRGLRRCSPRPGPLLCPRRLPAGDHPPPPRALPAPRVPALLARLRPGRRWRRPERTRAGPAARGWGGAGLGGRPGIKPRPPDLAAAPRRAQARKVGRCARGRAAPAGAKGSYRAAARVRSPRAGGVRGWGGARPRGGGGGGGPGGAGPGRGRRGKEARPAS